MSDYVKPQSLQDALAQLNVQRIASDVQRRNNEQIMAQLENLRQQMDTYARKAKARATKVKVRKECECGELFADLVEEKDLDLDLEKVW